ncbi:hypothetical protein Ancab_005933, partial [Ancistrocladus abbreviatus]
GKGVEAEDEGGSGGTWKRVRDGRGCSPSATTRSLLVVRGIRLATTSITLSPTAWWQQFVRQRQGRLKNIYGPRQSRQWSEAVRSLYSSTGTALKRSQCQSLPGSPRLSLRLSLLSSTTRSHL